MTTTIDTASGSLPAALTQTASTQGTAPALGQDSFLRLLTTQLKNQNPLEPLNNNEFISQMAQFSTVSGIEQLNSTLGGISGGMSGFGLPSASALIGRAVLVESGTALPDAGGAIRGRLTLDTAATAVVITYSDATSGELLFSQNLGAQPSGDLDFAWDEVPAAIRTAGRRVEVRASVSTAGATQEIGTRLYAPVVGAQFYPETGDTTLQIEGYGTLSLLEVQNIR